MRNDAGRRTTDWIRASLSSCRRSPLSSRRRVFDKPVYSAFAGHKLHRHLQDRCTDTLVVTGSETDACVLATVIGAVDRGYRSSW